MKEYPAELTLMFFYNLFVSILAAFVGLIAEPDSGKWIIRPNISLASILCSVSDDNSCLFLNSHQTLKFDIDKK